MLSSAPHRCFSNNKPTGSEPASPLTHLSSTPCNLSCSALSNLRWGLTTAASLSTMEKLYGHNSTTNKDLEDALRHPMGMAGLGNITESCGANLDSFQEQIWPILLVQFILAVVGNGLAIYRFLTYERKWNTCIIYCFNLAVSDLLYAISLFPMILYYFPPKDWTYGPVLCALTRFFFFCNLYGSTFFIACISLNRYIAIVHPIFAQVHIRLHHAKFLSGTVWLLVVMISIPVLRFSTLNHVSQNNTNRTQCLGTASREQLPKYWPYSLFLMVFGFGLPFILTCVSCGVIIYTIHHNHNIPVVKKRKVKILVSLVVVLYLIFYLPFHAVQNLYLSHRMHNREDCDWPIHTAFQLAKILVHFHICIHPLVYAAQMNSIQKYHCSFFCWHREREKEEKKVELRLWNQLLPQDHKDL
ncbi:P2Y purinoceptor 11 [Sceloporus undulatus]|uniref:P2Y purinoceptor 11 n=1 Tax=Sceloporus undulatus TaxID=8520 RepID=UPI001C4B19BB|nr:P2Y purinoceptor 11 [Sceloporus undulatus]